MRAALLALPLLAACGEPEDPGMLFVRGAGPQVILQPDAPVATLAFVVEADEELMRLAPRRRAVADVWVELPMAAYVGACGDGPCEDGVVTAVLSDADGAVVDESEAVAIAGQAWGTAFQVRIEDDPFGACVEDEPCALAFSAELTLASDAWVTVEPFVLSRVWPDVRPTHAVFDEEHLALTWE